MLVRWMVHLLEKIVVLADTLGISPRDFGGVKAAHGIFQVE